MNEKKQEVEASISVIVLAAGKGTRMNSPLPKVLHPAAGLPMVRRVLKAAELAGAKERRVVVGHGEALVRKVIEPMGAIAYRQAEQNGTAHAVLAADPASLNGIVMILNGDNPLYQAEELKALIEEFKLSRADLAVVTAVVKNPGSLGRIVRERGELRAIVEVSDAGPDTLKIKEINSGTYIAKAEVLVELLSMVKPQNKKGEYYLTDIISLGREASYRVVGLKGSRNVAFGVNTQAELALATNVLFKRNRKKALDAGVIMVDPSTTYIDDEVKIGSGTVIYPSVTLRGETQIGSCTVLESQVHITDSLLGESCHIKAGSYIENSVLGPRVHAGPYARLRPETVLSPDVHIGNFVELKKTKMGSRSKAGHLTYLGDAVIGEDVNIGCGTITCNYAPDRKKYVTEIGNKVFVGSDVQFVAPVKIGDSATIASGSTITEEVPAEALAIARGRQVNKLGWRP